MASLKKGVLLKLVEDIKANHHQEEEDADDDPIPKPVVLQIRGIIPVLEEGDLWPNKGFFLKVSDSSHALYVSLSPQENEMILGNKLKLGQFIHVKKLEKSHPVPLLRGVTPVPCWRRCEGTPEDIVFPSNFDSNSLGLSPVDSIEEKGVISEEKKINTCDFDSPIRARRAQNLFSDIDSVENDSDCDSVASSASSSYSRTLKRRSWNETDLFGVEQIFDSKVAAKTKIKWPPRSRSANVSPVRCVRYDSSDDNSSTISRRRLSVSTKRPIKSSSKTQPFVLHKGNTNNNSHSSNSFTGLKKGAETGISWNSLPQNLVKLGKEVVRQRDIALLAATEALQEACVSERLLNSLSTFSQFSSAESDDLQPNLDKFFQLHQDLTRTRLIMHSLTSISPFRTRETESGVPSSPIKETFSIALERKKNCMAWLKSAVAVDLSLPSEFIPTNPLNDLAKISKRSTRSTYKNKPRSSSIIPNKNKSSNTDFSCIPSSQKEEQTDWNKGGSLSSAAELASSLQEESRQLFLINVEKYIDDVERRMESRGEMAAAMHSVKMVSDFLDMIVNRDGNSSPKNGGLEEDEAEIYGRVRDRIYGILLKHVERTTMSFQSFDVSFR